MYNGEIAACRLERRSADWWQSALLGRLSTRNSLPTSVPLPSMVYTFDFERPRFPFLWPAQSIFIESSFFFFSLPVCSWPSIHWTPLESLFVELGKQLAHYHTSLLWLSFGTFSNLVSFNMSRVCHLKGPPWHGGRLGLAVSNTGKLYWPGHELSSGLADTAQLQLYLSCGNSNHRETLRTTTTR